MNPNNLISKSAFLDGLQCQKLLWKRFHSREEIPEPDASQQAIFDQGRELGCMARLLFPGGKEIGAKMPEEVEQARADSATELAALVRGEEPPGQAPRVVEGELPF